MSFFHLFAHVRCVNATSFVVRHITCGSCGREYVYKLFKTVRSPYWALWRAEEARLHAEIEAQSKLPAALNAGEGYAPCPYCGWIQESMLHERRMVHAAPLLVAAVALLMTCAIMYYIDLQVFAAPLKAEDQALASGWRVVELIILTAGLLLLFIAGFRHFIWDPNSLPLETRLAEAAKVSTTKEAYLELQKANEE